MDEDKINDMAYVWFNLVLEALGKRLNYESISNLYGNSFAKDAGKHIQAANPLTKNGGSNNSGIMGLMGQIKIIKQPTNNSPDAARKAVEAELGDVSWADGLF